MKAIQLKSFGHGEASAIGVSGGVGGAVTQIAKARGARSL